MNIKKKKPMTASDMAKKKSRMMTKTARVEHAKKMVNARKWHPVKA